MSRRAPACLALLAACALGLARCDATASAPPGGPGAAGAPAPAEGEAIALVEASGIAVRGAGKVAVIGGDETKDRLWAVNLADPAKRWELPLPRDLPMLDDVEAVAPWGEHALLVVCSQSRTRTHAKVKPERDRLALVTLSPDAREVRGAAVFEGLRDHLVTRLLAGGAVPLADPQAVAGQVAAQGGLNVEGLAAWKGRLLVGLRSPTARDGGAIVIPIRNPEALFAGGAAARPDLDKPIVLATAPGEGIRDMAADGDAVLVLLGPRGDVPEADFRIVRWNPDTGDLKEVRAPGLADIAVPEGIAPDPDGGLLVVQDRKPPLPKQILFRLKVADP